MSLLTVPLRAVGQYRENFHLVIPGAAAEVRAVCVAERTDHEVVVRGKVVGLLPSRGVLIDALARGWQIFGARVSWTSGAVMEKAAPGIALSVFYSWGAASKQDLLELEQYSADPPERERKVFRVGLVGESFYQPAIARCAAGDDVMLLAEPHNAHDPRAIGAWARGQQLGYLPRDGWLTRAMLDEGKAPTASIESIEQAAAGKRGVVVTVSW